MSCDAAIHDAYGILKWRAGLGCGKNENDKKMIPGLGPCGARPERRWDAGIPVGHRGWRQKMQPCEPFAGNLLLNQQGSDEVGRWA